MVWPKGWKFRLRSRRRNGSFVRMPAGKFRVGGRGTCSLLCLPGDQIQIIRGANRPEPIRTSDRGSITSVIDQLRLEVDRLVEATVDWVYREADERDAAIVRVATAGSNLFK